MPLFFLVSGALHKQTGQIKWRHYAKSILWPTFIFIILRISADVLFHGARITDELRFYFIDMPLGRFGVSLWFLFALFWCKVFFDWYGRLQYKFPAFILWGCFLFIPVFLLNTSLPFALSQGLMAFPIYAAGFYGKAWLVNQKPSIKWMVPFVCCLILTALITKYIHGRVSMAYVRFGTLRETLFGHSSQDFSLFARALLQLFNIALFYINGLIGSIMILSFSLLPLPKASMITPVSKSRLTVVGTQDIFISLILSWIGYSGFFLTFCLSLCVFILCFLTHKLLQPIYQIFRPSTVLPDGSGKVGDKAEL